MDLLIDTYICKKGMRPNEIIEVLFTMESRYRAITGRTVPIGFEKAKLEKVIRHLLELEMRKRNHWLMFKDLAWDKDKNERIHGDKSLFAAPVPCLIDGNKANNRIKLIP